MLVCPCASFIDARELEVIVDGQALKDSRDKELGDVEGNFVGGHLAHLLG